MEAQEPVRSRRSDPMRIAVQLPEVSGIEVTRWLKEDNNLKDVPVIAVTAFAMKGDEEKIRDGGCEAYLLPVILEAAAKQWNPGTSLHLPRACHCDSPKEVP